MRCVLLFGSNEGMIADLSQKFMQTACEDLNDAFRVWDTGEEKHVGIHETEVLDARPFHKYLLGKEVLKDAYFLNRCDYLLCGHSNITNVVLLWNCNKFKKVLCIGEDEDILR